MKSKKIITASFWYTISSFLLKGISFFTVPIFTRIMSESELGQYTALTTWISLLLPIVTISLHNSVILAKYNYKEEYNRYLCSISILGFITTSIIYLIAVVGMDFTVKITKLQPYVVHIMFLYLLAVPGVEIFQAKLRADLRYIPVVIISISSTLISVGLSLSLVLHSNEKFKARTIGTYFPLIIIYFALLLYLIIKGKSFSWKYNKFALSMCIPLVVHGLASNIMHSSDKLMIQQLCNDESVALYGVAYSCGMLINIIRNSLESAWDPWLFEKLNDNKRQLIKRYSYPYILTFAIMSLGVIMLAPEIMLILGGDAYREACYVIPPVVMAYFITMLYSLYSALEIFFKQQKWFALFAIISAGTNIGLNILFIPMYGYIAAAYTTFISSCIEFSLHYINAKRLGYTDAYNNIFNFFTIIVCVVLSGLIILTYDKIILRMIIVGLSALCIIVLGIVKRKNIVLYIKEIKE